MFHQPCLHSGLWRATVSPKKQEPLGRVAGLITDSQSLSRSRMGLRKSLQEAHATIHTSPTSLSPGRDIPGCLSRQRISSLETYLVLSHSLERTLKINPGQSNYGYAALGIWERESPDPLLIPRMAVTPDKRILKLYICPKIRWFGKDCLGDYVYWLLIHFPILKSIQDILTLTQHGTINLVTSKPHRLFTFN